MTGPDDSPGWLESGHRIQADILQAVVDDVLTHPKVRTVDDVREVLVSAIEEFRRRGGGG